MNKTIKLLKAKGAKKKLITSNHDFSSFENSFTIEKINTKDKDFFKSNWEILKYKNHAIIDEVIQIDDSSPQHPSNSCYVKETDNVDIDSDHSLSDTNETENETIKRRTFDLSAIIDSSQYDDESDQVPRVNQRCLKNGYEEMLETLLRRNKSENAISRYINRFTTKPVDSKMDDKKDSVKLLVLKSQVSFNFFQAWTKLVDCDDKIILIISISQLKDIKPRSILLVSGKRSVASFNDTVVWYNIEHISSCIYDKLSGIDVSMCSPKPQTISVACDCLSDKASVKASQCPNSQRNVSFQRHPSYSFEKNFTSKSILILKKLQFWDNKIVRYCLVFVTFNKDNIGTICVTNDLFNEISEGSVYLPKNEVRLPDTDEIYGIAQKETEEYLCYIYQQLCLESQDKINCFMGQISGDNRFAIFNCSSISNFDGRLCSLRRIHNGLIEFIPNCLKADYAQEKLRFNISGIAIGYGIECIEDRVLLKVFLFTSSVSTNVCEIILKKSCVYPEFAWSKLCKICLIDCYKLQGKIIADQYTDISAECINTMSYMNFFQKKITVLETVLDIVNAPSGCVARFEGMSLVSDAAERTLHSICSNCFSVILNGSMCGNCTRVKEGHLFLYELSVMTYQNYVYRRITFFSMKTINSEETMFIIGDDHKLCLLLNW